MREKFIVIIFSFLAFALVAMLSSSCTKDKCEEVYSYTVLEPVYLTYGEFRSGAVAEGPRPLENIGKVAYKNRYLFANEINQGIHVIDNRDPNSPVPIAFLAVPGSMDLGIKGNTLYADSFTDLVTFNVGDPYNCDYLSRVEDVFPKRDYSFIPDYKLEAPLDQTLGVILEFIESERVAVLPCDSTPHQADIDWEPWVVDDWLEELGTISADDEWQPAFLSGSSKKFSIVDDYLFAVDEGYLTSYRIFNPMNISKIDSTFVDWGLSSIQPYHRNNVNYLFAGSGSNTFFYEVRSTADLHNIGKTRSFTGCDNVIADDNRAYVTSRNFGSDACSSVDPQLQIFQIDTLHLPQPVSSTFMTNPVGLGIDGNQLFVCDEDDGLHIFDVSNPIINQMSENRLPNVTGSDVRLFEIDGSKLVLVIGRDGLYQYDYTSTANIELLSIIHTQPD